MKILAIETSCDETSIALVEGNGGLTSPQFKVLKNIVSSQIAIHAPFGGVVPNLAKREHIKNLPTVLKTLEKSRKAQEETDAIAVTVGPGLEPALWTGIEFAKELSKKWGKPLLGANHMEGHLYSNWLPHVRVNPKTKAQKSKKIEFPAVALVVSGGHTILLAMQSLTKWKKLGETHDDAAGEAFDKVSKMMKLPYPGGPVIQKLALKGNETAINFPRPMINTKDYDFSFSGLKTAVLYYLRDNPKTAKEDVAASFQKAAIDVLVSKTMRAVREYGAKSILLSGGVAANTALRKSLNSEAKRFGLSFYVPPFEYNTDNAAMIAAAAYIGHLKKMGPAIGRTKSRGAYRRPREYKLVAQSNLSL